MDDELELEEASIVEEEIQEVDDDDNFVDDMCCQCKSQILESIVTFEGKSYHQPCFVCHKCGNDLCGHSIYKVDAKLTCTDCYSKYFARRCAVCDLPLVKPKEEKYASFGDYTYHADCFRCEECERTLLGVKFFILTEGNICEDCYEKRKQEAREPSPDEL